MVSSSEIKRDGSEAEIQLSEYGEVTVSRKRRKVSELAHRDLSSNVCEEQCRVNASSSVDINNDFVGNKSNSLSSCNCDDGKLSSRVDPSCQLNGGNESISCSSAGGTSYPINDSKLNAGVDMSGQLNDSNESISRTSTGGSTEGAPYSVKTEAAYASPAYVSSWMYVNAQGQMCGPYIHEQLYEGLSSGFLPDDLPVYPILNGSLINPVPLNYFKQFPDHVATGFAYLPGSISGVKAPKNSQTFPSSDFSSDKQELATTSGSNNSQTAYSACVNFSNVNSNPQGPNTDATDLSKPYMPVVIKSYLLINLHSPHPPTPKNF